MKIVCDSAIPFLKGVFEPYAEVLYRKGSQIAPSDVRDADALIVRTRTRCDASLLEGSKVRIVASATIGYDHIDTAWCDSRGILWTNAPGCNSGSVMQYIASVLAVLSRCLAFPLKGKTLGVVGVGHVGSKVAALARTLGLKLLLNDPPRERREGTVAVGVNGEDLGGAGYVPLDTLLRLSDIITLHTPLDESTLHLLDAKRLSLLRSGQILLNASRGEVVDGAALKEALAEGQIGAAVLDVWEGEPRIDTGLLDLLELGTPHIAGYSADGKANGSAASVRAVAKCLGIEALSDWKVSEIPLEGRSLTLDVSAGDDEALVKEAILRTYDVREDCERLRDNPAEFENLRAGYPIRREFSAWKVQFDGTPSEGLVTTLRTLGFTL